MPVVGGRYQIAERLGGGGMADVFRARDLKLDRDVALKLMRPAFAGDRLFVERFRREAEALGAIDHPNIVQVLDFGTTAEGPYIAMEFVPGGTLRDLMRSRGRLDQYTAARIGAAIADGLEAAHVRGVLHRDLKPDNVLLDLHGRPKIADFGIARLAAATAITRAGELLGTPQYLAPEQMTDDVVDERVDVYALGVILHEMLTGEQPTGGKTPSEIVSRRLRTDPRPPSRLVPLAPAMNALVLRALARDPSRRFRRATALRDALLEITPPEPRTRTVKRAMKAPSIALPSPRIPRMSVRLPSFAPFAAAVAAMRSSVDERLADWLGRLAYAGRRSAAPLTAALALLAAVAGGALAVSARPDVAARPVVLATAIPAPAAAVLASTSSPVPIRSPETTAVPAAVPIAEPSIEATSAPTPAAVAVTAGGDPAGTIVTFYRFITGHDYASASGLWSDRMQAAYPPQTNIWGRFDRTTSIVARSASLTSASAGSAAVAVDLIETMRDGTTRHWVGSWYLVRSGAGWLLDSPGLRPA